MLKYEIKNEQKAIDLMEVKAIIPTGKYTLQIIKKDGTTIEAERLIVA